jgi:radical SAM superfamily enzyme YgiQ (UPF0313 family)
LAQDFLLTGAFSLTPEQIADDLLKMAPDVVCFSMYTYFYRSNIELMGLIKKRAPEVVTICGGVHVSLLPHVALQNPQVDFVVVGEAEESLPNLIDALERLGVAATKALDRQALPGVWNLVEGAVAGRGLSPGPRNLDELPFPEKQLHYAANPALARMYTITASRGCLYACSYCNSASLGRFYRDQGAKYYRTRSVANVIAELKVACDRFPPRYVSFHDDHFGVDPEWLREFCARYAQEVGIPYGIQTNPKILDFEGVGLLAQSGCVALELGFQSAVPEVRDKVLNRRETNERTRDLMQQAKQHRLLMELDLIFNLPGEVPDHIEQALEFVRDTRPELINVGYLEYFPRTPIIQQGLESGAVTEADLDRIDRGECSHMLRLLSRSGVNSRYRLIPFQMFFASRLPQALSRLLGRLVERPAIGALCSRFASYFIYTWRIAVCLGDRRAFFDRVQLARILRGARIMLMRKLRG